MLTAINFVLFQVGWFASVLGAANELPWLGPVVVAVAILWHLRTAARPVEELMLIGVCAIAGAIFDSVLVLNGWVRYPDGVLTALLAPYWIVGMWMLFATTLNVSLRWLRGRPVWAAAFGFVGGPLSYLAGARLGGIELLAPTAALAALAVGWATIMPALLVAARHLDGISPGNAAREWT